MGDVVPLREPSTTAATTAPGTAPGTAPTTAPGTVPTDPLWRELAGQTLRATRHVREQTLAHVATRAGVSVQYLSEIERGRKEPSSEVLAAVAGALDLTLGDLLVAVTRRLDSFRQPSFRRITTSEPTGPVALAA